MGAHVSVPHGSVLMVPIPVALRSKPRPEPQTVDGRPSLGSFMPMSVTAVGLVQNDLLIKIIIALGRSDISDLSQGLFENAPSSFLRLKDQYCPINLS